MNKINSLGVFSLLVLLSACGTHRNTGTAAQKVLLDDLVATKKYEIISQWAKPLASTAFLQLFNTGGMLPAGSNGNHINIMGNTNYVRVYKDSVAIELPFFGVRQRGGGYNSDVGISYEGPCKEYKMHYNAAKKYYQISFEIQKKTEQLQFTIRLYENLKSTIALTSSDRSFIDYDGKVLALTKE